MLKHKLQVITNRDIPRTHIHWTKKPYWLASSDQDITNPYHAVGVSSFYTEDLRDTTKPKSKIRRPGRKKSSRPFPDPWANLPRKPKPYKGRDPLKRSLAIAKRKAWLDLVHSIVKKRKAINREHQRQDELIARKRNVTTNSVTHIAFSGRFEKNVATLVSIGQPYAWYPYTKYRAYAANGFAPYGAFNNLRGKFQYHATRQLSPDGGKLGRYINNVLPKIDDFIPVNSIITAILELGDLKEFIPGILKSLKNLLRVKPQGASEAWLWTNFALLPTISDITTFLTIARRIDGVIGSWNALAASGKTFVKHGTLIHANGPTFGNLVKDIDPVTFVQSVPIMGDITCWDLQPKGRTTITIKYRPTHIEGSGLFLSHLLGLDNIISGIWNGMPFSWLVDYFFNVGDIIDGYLTPICSLPIKVVDASLSRKYTGRHFCIYSVNELAGELWLTQRQIATSEGIYKFYDRYDVTNLVTSLHKLNPVELSLSRRRLTKHHFLNGSAFLHTRSKL